MFTELTSLAAKRDSKSKQEKTKRKDVGRASEDDQDQEATVRDLVQTLVPASLIAPYILVITTITGVVADPTTQNPEPDQHAGWRWLAFGVIATLALVAILVGYYTKRPSGAQRKFPWAEMIAGMAATAAWGLSIPGSPLQASLSPPGSIVAPIAVLAFGAALIGAAFPSLLKGAKKSA